MDVLKDIIDGNYTLTNIPPKQTNVLFFLIENYFYEIDDKQLPLSFFLLNHYNTICIKGFDNQVDTSNVNEFCENYYNCKVSISYEYISQEKINETKKLLNMEYDFSGQSILTYEKKKGNEYEIPLILDIYLNEYNPDKKILKTIFKYAYKLKGLSRKITQLSIIRQYIKEYHQHESIFFTKYFFSIYLNTPKRLWYFLDKLTKEYSYKKAFIEKYYQEYKTLICDKAILETKPQFSFLGNIESISLDISTNKKCLLFSENRNILFCEVTDDVNWDEVKSIFYISCCTTFNRISYIEHSYFNKIPFLAMFESIKKGCIVANIFNFAHRFMIENKYDRGIEGLIKRYQSDLHFRNKNNLSMLSSMLIQYYIVDYKVYDKKRFFTVVIENEIRQIIKNIDFKIFINILSDPSKKLKYETIKKQIEEKLNEKKVDIYTLYNLDKAFDKIFKNSSVKTCYFEIPKIPLSPNFFDDFYDLLEIENKDKLIAHQIIQAFRFRTKRGILKYQNDYTLFPKEDEEPIKEFSDKFFMEKVISL